MADVIEKFTPLILEDELKPLPEGWVSHPLARGFLYQNEKEKINISIENTDESIEVSASVFSINKKLQSKHFTNPEEANQFVRTLLKKYSYAVNLFERPRYQKGSEVYNNLGNKEQVYEAIWDFSKDKYGYYLSPEHKKEGISYDEDHLLALEDHFKKGGTLEDLKLTVTTSDPKEQQNNNPSGEKESEGNYHKILADDISMFIHGNYYKAFPEKILGRPYKASGRFGEVTKYKGTLKDLEKIDTSGIRLDHQEDDFSLSLIESDIDPVTALADAQVKAHIEKAIQRSEKEITQKVITRIHRRTENDEPKIHDLLTFDEVFRAHNKDISEEELKAFIWYKHEIGQPLGNLWNNFKYNGESFNAHTHVSRQTLDEWVNRQILCYHQGQLLPAYLYFAENLYERMQTLQDDKPEILELYGAETFQRQEERLHRLFEETVHRKRLIIDEVNEHKQLTILPTSDFAETFTVQTLTDEQPFKMKPIKRKEGYGKPDFLEDYKWPNGKLRQLYPQLSLQEAFQYWLVKHTKSIEFKKGTNYQEIITVYLQQKQMPPVANESQKPKAKAEWERKRARSKEEGDRLFALFLRTQLLSEDKKRIEDAWNKKFNGYLKINYHKVPIAFRATRTYRNESLEVRAEKREGAAFIFSEGSGCIAYDVGFGKTWTAIFTIAQFLDAGYCKRPFIVVPNQTYKQWLSEIKGILPHIPVNDLYNLSKDYLDELKGAEGKTMMVPENSITLLTYEGFERIGFNEYTESTLLNELYTILNQGEEDGKEKSVKQIAAFMERLKTIIGRGLKGTMLSIEDLGFDFMAVDEAHAMKKIFTAVKGKADEETGKKERTQYKIHSGVPSSIGLKGFMISQYILRNNHFRNVLLLTATPFTNSPLEIFSMLALIAYRKLEESDINNLTNFFDNYIQVNTELVINSKLKPERRQIVTGFNNIPALQTLIFRFINFKNADTKDQKGNKVHIVRPDKYVLPLKGKMVNGDLIELEEEEQVHTALPLSPLQEDLMVTIKQYVEGKVNYKELCKSSPTGSLDIPGEELDEDENNDQTEGVEVDEESLSVHEKSGVRMLKGMNLARNLALSPYLHRCSGLGSNPTYLQYIETSPKLHYVMKCIQSVKTYHEERGQPVSGQVIYMDRGIEYFHLIAEYLVKKIGYQPHEVGIIKSQMKGGKTAKEQIKNKFLGLEYNEQTRNFKELTDSERMKILIGSSTIKEGMNLQRKSTVLYDCFLDWNPTDLIQLEGRIWRQGNEFASVRIVHPLMENSMDIFMFQKLEEKTNRINQIWDIDSESSVLKLEEFNPAELKYELISDPVVIAELEAKEVIERFNDTFSGINFEYNRIKTILYEVKEIERLTKLLREEVSKHRDIPDIENLSLKYLIDRLNEIFFTQLNKEGNPFKQEHRPFQKRITHEYSEGFYKPYWFQDLLNYQRNIQKETEQYLVPKGLKIEDLPSHQEKLKQEAKDLEEKRKKLTSEESLQLRASEIREERSKNDYARKSLEERVEEFQRLNYLLDHKLVKDLPQAPKLPSVPLLDAHGNRRIDEEALRVLESLIAALPQTKALHIVSPEEYTEDRKILHQKIIEGVLEGKECVDKTKAQPICILTGGLPGSGKSTFLAKYSQWLTSEKVFKIDADDIRSRLPEYRGWNAAITHLETKDIVNTLLDHIGEPCDFDMVYDGTMNKARNYIPLIEKIKKLGYKIFVIYMKIPYEISKERVLERYQRSGRFVPMEIIDEVYEKGLEAFNIIKEMVDGYVLVDGISQEIIEKGGEGIPTDRGYQLHEELAPVDEDLLLKENEAEAIMIKLRLTKKRLELKRAREKKQIPTTI